MKRLISYLRYLWHITAGFHRKVFLRTLLGVVKVGVMLSFIWLSKTAIDCATGRVEAPREILVRWFILMVGCLLIDVVLSQCINYMQSRETMLMTNRVNRRLFNVLMNLPPVNGQQGFHSGDMLNRLTLDVRTVTNFSLTQLPSMVVLAVQLVASFAFLATLSPWLAMAPLIIMPVCLLVSKRYFRRNRRLTTEIREGESNMHVSIQEGLKHRMVLKSLECIDEMDRRLGKIQAGLEGANKKQAKLSVRNGAFVRIGFSLGYLTAFGFGVFDLADGLITFGTMSAFIQLVNRIQRPISGISSYLPSFVSTSVAIDRLREIDVELGSGYETALMKRPGVRVKNMSFRYETDEKDILSSFSHDFAPGSRTMIVGSTGAGKTTLIKLLLGLLRPVTGSIEIYGEEGSREVSEATLCNFVYVPQGNTLLNGTVRENLLLAAPDATEEQLREALHIAVADFVYDLPAGLETACDEAGGGLSEGQAQRIAIARALLRPGSIMLLDEFNSALDSETAHTLMQRLATHCPDATILIIAHHQSAIQSFCTQTIRITPA